MQVDYEVTLGLDQYKPKQPQLKYGFKGLLSPNFKHIMQKKETCIIVENDFH